MKETKIEDNRIRSERLEDYFLTCEQRRKRLQAKIERVRMIAQIMQKRESLVKTR